MSAAVRQPDARPEPILVCGVGRSGTSLLQAMLAAHPLICFPPETHFFRRYAAHPGIRARHQRRGPEAFARILERDREFARAGIPARELCRPGEASSFDLSSLYLELLRRVAAREGKPLVGDKDPRNIDFLPELAGAFPRAAVLHIVRDPRDVLLSRTRAAWSASRPWWLHPMVYREQLWRGRRMGRQHFGGRYLEVRYEDLISDPQRSLRRIAAHLRVPYDAGMLEFGAAARRLVSEDELAWKRETLGPLLAGNSGKWAGGLSAAQVRLTESLCSEAFRDLGYVPAALPAPRGLLERLCLRSSPLLALGADLGWRARRRLQPLLEGTP